MPGTTAQFASRVNALRREHNQIIVDWVTRRIIEEMALDAYKLRADIERYVDWSALVVDAALVNLGKRRWTKTLDALMKRAHESLGDATSRKTDGAKGMPLLLKWAFFHTAFINFLGNEKARLVDANLEKELQAGFVLLGEARRQDLYRVAQDAYREALVVLTADVTAAGEQSLAVAAEPVSSSTIIPGGRPLSPVEQRLTGHWINQEFVTSGTTTGRFELHMVLLATGHLARTKKSVVFSSLQDSGGNWIGSLDSLSELSRAERGRWEAYPTLLTLEMDDGSAYQYQYSQQGSGMVTTNRNGGAQRYWTRSSR